jgi:hypothetical protein
MFLHSERDLKMEATCFSEMLVSIFEITRCHNSEDHSEIIFARLVLYVKIYFKHTSAVVQEPSNRLRYHAVEGVHLCNVKVVIRN